MIDVGVIEFADLNLNGGDNGIEFSAEFDVYLDRVLQKMPSLPPPVTHRVEPRVVNKVIDLTTTATVWGIKTAVNPFKGMRKVFMNA